MEIAWALLDRYQQLAGVSERRRVGGNLDSDKKRG